jgi:hypothetical protein
MIKKYLKKLKYKYKSRYLISQMFNEFVYENHFVIEIDTHKIY